MFLEILGVVVGLVYLYFEYKANKLVWIASVIMPCISMTIYFSKGLYADFGINIYYLLIAIYGWITWSRGHSKSKKKELPITHTPGIMYIALLLATAVIWGGIWWILTNYTNSTVPIPDSFTTALSIVALWMMARKYAEQWLAWFIVDGVCVALYIYKGIYFYAGLYAFYTIMALFGYKKWCQSITH